MKTLQQLQKEYLQAVKSMGGFLEATEFDQKLNSYQRAIIKAFKREKGQAFLGKINRYDKKEPYSLKKYISGMVYNFSYSFVIPKNEVLNLLSPTKYSP